MPWRRCRTTVSFRVLLVSALVPGGGGAAAENDPADAGTGYPENLVSDYLDSSSDGLTSIELPGTAAPSDVGSINFKDLLPTGGVGARFTVARANHVNARVDVAFSKQGVTFYLSVGEAF